jgi:hypothetical protein
MIADRRIRGLDLYGDFAIAEDSRQAGYCRKAVSTTALQNVCSRKRFDECPQPVPPSHEASDLHGSLSITVLFNIETILLWLFDDGWRIWSAVAEVAPRAWVHIKDILATADTAFGYSSVFESPAHCGHLEVQLPSKAVSAVARTPNTKRTLLTRPLPPHSKTCAAFARLP